MSPSSKTGWLVELGVVPYAPSWELQRRLVAARKAGVVPDVLLLCEHGNVITLGRNGKPEHLRASEHILRQMNVAFYATDRGGDVTYHGPGQIVGYPILDLTGLRRDVAWYVEQLEEVMIRTTAAFGITAIRVPGMHGIWVETAGPLEPEKLAAVGVHLSRWVTSHGFAYNVSTDLRYFDLIVPCGLVGKRATSLERILNRAVHRDEVAPRLARHFGEVFGREMRAVSRGELEDVLREKESPAAVGAAHP